MNIVTLNEKNENVDNNVTVDNIERDSDQLVTVYLSNGWYIILTQQEVEQIAKI